MDRRGAGSPGEKGGPAGSGGAGGLAGQRHESHRPAPQHRVQALPHDSDDWSLSVPAAPVVLPERIGSRREAEPGTLRQIGPRKSPGTCQRVVRAEHDPHRVAAQLTYRQARFVERAPRQRDVHAARAQAAGRIGEIRVPHPQLDTGMPRAERLGEAARPRVGAVSQNAHVEPRWTGRRRDPLAYPLGVVEQSARLLQEHFPDGSERYPCGRAQEERGAHLGLQLLDRTAQRRLAHVQPGGGPAEVRLLGDGHEIPQGA